MRLARYAWWLPLLLAIGGFGLISATDLCGYPRASIGPSPIRCDVDFLGMTLSTEAAGWLAAGIGGVLGTVLALILTGETARWTWPSVRRWIARIGLVIVGAGVLVVGGLAALRWFQSLAPRSTEKTWMLQPGETLRVPADEVFEKDDWQCKGGYLIPMTPSPGEEVIVPENLFLKVDRAGNVTFHCERPPGNV